MSILTEFFDLPVIRQAGPASALCYVSAMLYAARHQTDGAIPSGVLGSLADWDVLGTSGRAAAEGCVQVGLMERSASGYRLVDYRLVR